MNTKPVTAPLSAEISDRLLDLLSTDDAYRALFQADPRRALEEIGYVSPSPARMTACGAQPVQEREALIDCKINDLASKDAIIAARSEIHCMLTRGLTQGAPRLDASDGTSNVRRLRK